MSDRAGRASSLGDVVAWLALLIGLVSGWLYLAGWSYAYVYFDRFHLPLGLVGASTDELLVHGFLSLFGRWWVLPANGALLLLLIGSVHARDRLPPPALMVLLGGLTLAAGYLAHRSGASVAREDFAEQRESGYRAYPRVSVGLSASVAREALPQRLFEDDCAKLLLARPEYSVFIRPRRAMPALPLHAFVLPSASLEWMRVTDDYTSCRE